MKVIALRWEFCTFLLPSPGATAWTTEGYAVTFIQNSRLIGYFVIFWRFKYIYIFGSWKVYSNSKYRRINSAIPILALINIFSLPSSKKKEERKERKRKGLLKHDKLHRERGPQTAFFRIEICWKLWSTSGQDRTHQQLHKSYVW